MKNFSHTTDRNKIIFNLWDKPHPVIFSKREKQIVKSIIDCKVNSFVSFMHLYLKPEKLPDEYNFEHKVEIDDTVIYYLTNYYKTNRLVNEYISVIDHLEKEGFIFLNPSGKTPPHLPFLIKVTNKENTFQYPSSGLVQSCKSVYHKNIEPDIEELKTFYKHNCLDEITFNDNRNKNRQTAFTFCLVIITLIATLISLCIGNKQLQNAKDILNKSQNDTTFVKIIQFPDQSQNPQKVINPERQEIIFKNQINTVHQNDDTLTNN